MNEGYFRRELPEPLADLVELAFDLRWNDSYSVRRLWQRFDRTVWETTENPLLVLQAAHQDRIDAAAQDHALLAELDRWRHAVRRYYAQPPAWADGELNRTLKLVAYFSMEFGLSESLPIYSGGLGMLAGDHLKTASDLGVPIVGIGLLYQQGYFRQVVTADGQQLEAFPFNDPGSLPVRPLIDRDGHWLRVRLPLPGRTLWLRVWEARVGRIRLLLLDANDAMNTPWDRGITAQLYDAGREKRLLQEYVLGVGGWRLIERLELDVDVCHLNEGHAAFAVLARAAGYARTHTCSLPVALMATRVGNVFTTHTPVEAAFDCFDPKLLAMYLGPFLSEIGLSFDEFLGLGRRHSHDASEPFNMACLAMRGACHANAVSQLHGEVSRRLFSSLFPRWPIPEVPVRAISNGVHLPTWSSHHAAQFWNDSAHEHAQDRPVEHAAQRIQALPNSVIWTFRASQRATLIDYLAARCSRQRTLSERDRQAEPVPERLDAQTLTIGFARRFATYKRANLLLQDEARLKRILLNQDRPVQLIVAGKAHPQDASGKALIQQWTQFLSQPELRRKALFVEDYDMMLGQHLVAGVDVWINTPLRSYEACGTSGMKVLVNGGLNVSVLDGWWDEAMTDAAPGRPPGWVVGTREPGTPDELNRRDAASLLDVLEHHVIPEFYERDAQGLPARWIERIKASMVSLTPRFSAERMMREYVEHAYLPAARHFAARTADGLRVAQDLTQWNERLHQHWHSVRIGQVHTQLDEGRYVVHVECWLDELPLDWVRVELYAERADVGPVIIPMSVVRTADDPGQGVIYRAELESHVPLDAFTVRLRPHHPQAFIPMENQSILWQR